MSEYIIALDQGTTSSRSILYDLSGKVVASSSYEYQISYPEAAWVEQDPTDIWDSQLKSLKDVLKDIDPKLVKSIGITNQRETIIAWDKESGEALAPAIVWQCRRTADFCNQLKSNPEHVKMIQEKTGLTIDPYFSASKIRWLIQNNKAVQEAYQNDTCIFGTVDSWLIYNLTKNTEAKFLTDASNASRTMLYNIINSAWDEELLNLFSIEESALCEVKASNADFGRTNILGLDAKICGVLGDQQASLLGHGATKINDIKCTFGTGAFLLLNTGETPVFSDNGLLTTIAWDLEKDGQREVTYAIEGSVFIAGSLIKWLRDKLGIIKTASETEELAKAANPNSELVIIPAFSGLGAPHWRPDVKGIMTGITQDTGKEEIALAALEAVAHQVADLFELEEFKNCESLSIDGAMIKNDFFNQLLADFIGCEIVLAESAESTAYGVFCLAGKLQHTTKKNLSCFHCKSNDKSHQKKELWQKNLDLLIS